MKNILLLSDNHSYMDDRILSYAKDADEIWNAGDLGSLKVVNDLEQLKIPIKAVYGNIDNHEIRAIFPEVIKFECEEIKVLIIHIGGYPGKYTAIAKKEIEDYKPQLFISGHSHILKAIYDKKNNLLHLNPGACGKQGWHKVRTMMRFKIDGKEITDLEIIELGIR